MSLMPSLLRSIEDARQIASTATPFCNLEQGKETGDHESAEMKEVG